MMLTIIVIEIDPSRSSVVAALRLFGRWNAGTPFEIASTPVSAAHPDEKARASSRIRPRVVSVSTSPTSGSGVIVRPALSTSGRFPAASWRNP